MESQTDKKQGDKPVDTASPTPGTAKAPPPAPQKKSKLVYVFVILLVLIVLTIGATFAVYISKSVKPNTTPTTEVNSGTNSTPATKTPTPTLEAIKESFEEDTAVLGQKRFTSPKFGVSFLYMQKQDTQTAAIKEEGNKIYVYIKELITDGKKDNYKGGQWVEVFSKDKTQTLEEAVTLQFLKNYAKADCFVSVKSMGTTTTNYPKSYITATISYPKPTDESEPFFANESKCPQGYSESNGLAYFLMDQNHPGIFTYLSIGQYGIYADKDKGWQDTIQFLPL